MLYRNITIQYWVFTWIIVTYCWRQRSHYDHTHYEHHDSHYNISSQWGLSPSLSLSLSYKEINKFLVELCSLEIYPEHWEQSCSLMRDLRSPRPSYPSLSARTWTQLKVSVISSKYVLSLVVVWGHTVTLSHCHTDIYIWDIILALATLVTVWVCCLPSTELRLMVGLKVTHHGTTSHPPESPQLRVEQSPASRVFSRDT